MNAAERIAESDCAPADTEPGNRGVQDYSCELLASCRVPKARRVVIRGGDDARPIGGEGRTRHRSSWPRNAMIFRPVAAFQIRAVPSQEAVTMRAPSGEKDPFDSTSLWPRSATISWPVVAEARRAVIAGGDDGGSANEW